MKYYKVIYFEGNFAELDNYLEFCKRESIDDIMILVPSTDLLKKISVLYAPYENLTFTDFSNFYLWMLNRRIENPRLFISYECGFPKKTPNIIKVNEYLNTHADIALYLPLYFNESVSEVAFIDDFPFKIYRGSNIDLNKVIPCAIPLVCLLNFVEKAQSLGQKNLVQYFFSIDFKSFQNLNMDLYNKSILTLFFNGVNSRHTNKIIGYSNGQFFTKFWFIYIFNKYFRSIKYIVEVYLPKLNLIYRKLQIFLKR